MTQTSDWFSYDTPTYFVNDAHEVQCNARKQTVARDQAAFDRGAQEPMTWITICSCEAIRAAIAAHKQANE